MFDIGALLSGIGAGGAESMGGVSGGQPDFFRKLMAATANPVEKDQLLTKLAMSGIAPPPLDATMPAAGGLGDIPQVPIGPNPVQQTIAGLTQPPQYPQSTPPVPGQEKDLGQLLAGAQSALKGMEQPKVPTQQMLSTPSPQAHGSSTMAKAPGYLPTTGGASSEQLRKTLGALLGGR